MMEIYDVKINGLINPIGYDFSDLVLSWKIRNSQGKKAKETQISIASDANFKDIIFRKSGNLNSLSQELNFPLKPYTRYYIKIQVLSDEDELAYSDGAFFETAKLDDKWQGKWIGTRDNESHPEFIKEFNIKTKVKNARLYICGLGLFEAYLNGKKIGDDLLAPFINDYQEHFQYCTYDVTDLLSKSNSLNILLGDGWYRGHFGLNESTHYDLPLGLILELRIEYENGEVESINSNESFLYRQSFTKLSDIYNGEIQDYNSSLGVYKQAILINKPGKLVQRYSLPLKYHEEFKVKDVVHTPANELVLDFGQNLAGHVICQQHFAKGTTLKLEFGEILQDGCFYHDNYRHALSEFIYISDGESREIRPRFTFYGFRYVKVTCQEKIDPDMFKVRAIYSELQQIGFIKTSNKKINQLIHNALWGLKSNFVDMPSDCPQRDERLGWSGDAQVFAPTASYFMDTRAFYDKYLRDLRTDQIRNKGAVALYLPNEFPGMFAAIWSDVATIIPDVLYKFNGDTVQLRRHYNLMKDWVDYIHNLDIQRGKKNLYDFGFQLGDWLALDGASEQAKFGATDSYFLASLYYYASTKKVAEAARVLEKREYQEYDQLAQDIKNAILDEYFTNSGRLAIDTQTAYVIALTFGVYKDKEILIDGLKKRIDKDLGKIKSGFAGAPIINCALADNGMVDQAYTYLFKEDYPSWLYAINLGATTIWERWNSVLADGHMSGTGMNSLNHYAYGSVVEFLFAYCAGIKPLAAGFKQAKIEPMIDIRLGHLNCSYDSNAGKYVVNWQINDDGSLDFHIEIPFDCKATLALPELAKKTLDSGSYDFHYQPKHNYLTMYNASTPYALLFNDPRAVKILEKYVPNVLIETDRNDQEAMYKGLINTLTFESLFRRPVDHIKKAIEEIEKLTIEERQ